MSKLCINECIPYVQKYEWGKGRDGLVYVVMKNIVKDNYEIIKKEINNLDYLKEYIENCDNDYKEIEDINNQKKNDEKNQEKNEKYAELWIGNHKKSPNLVIYNNTLIKIEEFLKIYENKKKKKNKIVSYIFHKLKSTKQRYLGKNTIKSEDSNSLKGNENANKNLNKEYSLSNKYSSKDENKLSDEIKNVELFPYLFKILSISKPLSIQIHPNEEQTIYLNKINPLLYKDKIFKTEICVCINSMSLLCGFMNVFKISFLIKNIRELNEFFLNSETSKSIDKNILKGNKQGGKELNNVKNKKREDIEQDSGTNRSPNIIEDDIFVLFELFNTDKKKYIEEIITMLSRIYIYIIYYVLKTGNSLNYDIISVIDNYAECIQKYVHDKTFFYSFYKNENFLKEDFNLNNLIKTNKEKLQDNLKKKNDNKKLNEFDVSGTIEVDESESNENEKYFSKNEFDKFNKIDEDEKEENKTDKNEKKKNNIDKNQEKESDINENNHSNNYDGNDKNKRESYFVNRKKIKAFYEHMYKFLTYKIISEDSKISNNCITSIIEKNEKYASFINGGDPLKKKIEDLYEDICLKKDYEILCKETEDIVIQSIFELLKNVSNHYMNDAGILFIFILQLINLNDGDVVYIKPGVIHSYISGHCLECMTNSDLVIRGGLTNKEVDKLNFIKYVNYKRNYPIILEKEFINYNIISYSYEHMKHFKILFITIRPGEKIDHIFSDKSFTSCIVLSTNKKVKMVGKRNDKKKIIISDVRNGMVLFIAPNVKVSISNFYSNAEDGSKEFIMYCATS